MLEISEAVMLEISEAELAAIQRTLCALVERYGVDGSLMVFNHEIEAQEAGRVVFEETDDGYRIHLLPDYLHDGIDAGQAEERERVEAREAELRALREQVGPRVKTWAHPTITTNGTNVTEVPVNRVLIHPGLSPQDLGLPSEDR